MRSTASPNIRAGGAVVERVAEHLSAQMTGGLVIRVCTHALHFAALTDAGIARPEAPADPFESLMVMFERGGGFRMEGSGLIEVDTLGIAPGTIDANLRSEPYVSLEQVDLDALDRR